MSEGRGGTMAFLHQCGVLSAGVLFKKSAFTWAVYAFTAIVWGPDGLIGVATHPSNQGDRSPSEVQHCSSPRKAHGHHLKEADSDARRERFTLPEGERMEKLRRLSLSEPLPGSGMPILPFVGLRLPMGCPARRATDGLGSCAPGESSRSLHRPCGLTEGAASCEMQRSCQR